MGKSFFTTKNHNCAAALKINTEKIVEAGEISFVMVEIGWILDT
jgi:hypothetical protein